MIRQEQGHWELGRVQSHPFHLIDFSVIYQECIRSESGFSSSHFMGPGKATLPSLRSGVMPAPWLPLKHSPQSVLTMRPSPDAQWTLPHQSPGLALAAFSLGLLEGPWSGLGIESPSRSPGPAHTTSGALKECCVQPPGHADRYMETRILLVQRVPWACLPAGLCCTAPCSQNHGQLCPSPALASCRMAFLGPSSPKGQCPPLSPTADVSNQTPYRDTVAGPLTATQMLMGRTEGRRWLGGPNFF